MCWFFIMIGIYKITSPSNKIYIGQSIDIKKRFNNYKSIDCISQTKLYYSLIKHGFDAHVLEVIEECSIDSLNERERYWQEYYNVLSENGLNCVYTKTNDKSGMLSKDTIKKISNNRKGIASIFLNIELRNLNISKSLTGKKLSESHKKSLSIAQTGLKRSPEAIKKSSESRKGIKFGNDFKEKIKNRQTGGNNSFAKLVLNTETGIFYDTANDAAKSIGWTYSRLSHYMNGRTKRKLPFIYV